MGGRLERDVSSLSVECTYNLSQHGRNCGKSTKGNVNLMLSFRNGNRCSDDVLPATGRV